MSTNCVGRHIRGAENRAWVSMRLGGPLTPTRSIACSIGFSSSAWPIQHRQSSNSLSQVLYRKKSLHNSAEAVWTRVGATGNGQHMEGKETRDCGSLGRSSSLSPVLRRQLPHQRQTRRARARGRAEACDQVGAHLRARCGLQTTSLREEMRLRACCFETKAMACVIVSKEALVSWIRARAPMFVLAVVVLVGTISASVCRAGSLLSPELQTSSLLNPFLPHPLLSCTPIP